MNNNLINIPVYVISLRRDSDRREFMKKKFPAHWSSLTIIDAIDARDLPENYPAMCPELKRKPMTRTEIACALSHLKAWEIFEKSNFKSCIILEDDIDGTDEELKMARSITSSLSGEFFILLGGQQGLRNNSFIYGRPHNFRGEPVWWLPEIVRRFISRACCYGLSRSTVEELVAQQYQGLDRADHWHRLLRGISGVYYADVLKHPLDLSTSHLEPERQKAKTNSFFGKIWADGLFYTSISVAIKSWLLIFSRALELTRITVKSE